MYDFPRSIELAVYLKQNKNSFPFKILEKVHYIMCVPSDKESKSFQKSLKHDINQIKQKKKLYIHNIGSHKYSNSIMEPLSGSSLSKPLSKRAQLQELSKRSLLFQEDSSKMAVNCSTDILIKTTEYSNSINTPKHSILPPSVRKQRFLTEPSSIPSINSGTKILKMQQIQPMINSGRKQDKEFINNFINLSNFIAKQHQKSQNRNKHRRFMSQIVEATHNSREKQINTMEYIRACKVERMRNAKLGHHKYKLSVS